MHDHLSNLRPLATQSVHRYGKARPVHLRHRHTLDVLPTATHMPRPQACSRGCAGCPREVAQSQINRVIAVTAQSWGVTA